MVPSERITGCQEENGFQHDETLIDPVDVAEGAKFDSVANVGDRCGDTHNVFHPSKVIQVVLWRKMPCLDSRFPVVC